MISQLLHLLTNINCPMNIVYAIQKLILQNFAANETFYWRRRNASPANCWIWKTPARTHLICLCTAQHPAGNFAHRPMSCGRPAALWRLLVQPSRQSAVRSVAVRAHTRTTYRASSISSSWRHSRHATAFLFYHILFLYIVAASPKLDYTQRRVRFCWCYRAIGCVYSATLCCVCARFRVQFRASLFVGRAVCRFVRPSAIYGHVGCVAICEVYIVCVRPILLVGIPCMGIRSGPYSVC